MDKTLYLSVLIEVVDKHAYFAILSQYHLMPPDNIAFYIFLEVSLYIDLVK